MAREFATCRPPGNLKVVEAVFRYGSGPKQSEIWKKLQCSDSAKSHRTMQLPRALVSRCERVNGSFFAVVNTAVKCSTGRSRSSTVSDLYEGIHRQLIQSHSTENHRIASPAAVLSRVAIV